MRGLCEIGRRYLSLAAGAILGFAIVVCTTVYAAGALPNLSLTGITGGQTVSGIVSLSAQADATGLAGVQFQVSSQNVGAQITSGSCSTQWDTRTLPDGQRTISAMGTDSLGNSVTTPAILVNVVNSTPDTTAPTVSISAPTAGATVSGTVTASASATDDVGVASVWFTLDGATLGAEDTSAPYQTSWTTTGAGNGAHTIRAFARDAAGNVGSSSALSVTVNNAVADTAAPSISILAPTGGSSVSGTVTLSASASDNVGVASVQFTVDGANVGTPDTTAPYSASWPTTGIANGTHVVGATARDAAGNVGTATSVSVSVNNVAPDSIAPTVSITAPGGGTTVSGVLTVSATASDNIGVAGVQFRLDGAVLGTEDTSAPYSVSWATTGATNGTHTLTATARDAAGNTTTSTGITVIVNNTVLDTIAPTVSMTAPGSFSTVSGAVAVAATASDNVGVIGVQFTLDGGNLGTESLTAPYAISWDTTTATNGSHTLRAIARDAAGNRKTSSSRTVTVNNSAPDTTAPTVSLSAPAPGTTVTGQVTVSANATDNLAVTGVQFTLDGANLGSLDTTSPYSITWSTTGVSNGSHVLGASARDAAGNVGTATAITVTVNNSIPDTTAPTVSLTVPAPGATVNGIVAVSATASDNVGVVGVQFTLDGAILGAEDMVAPYGTNWATTSTSNGTHMLRAVARDAAGNTTTTPGVTVTVNNVAPDTTAPTVSVTAPTSGATVSGSVSVSATAADNVGVVGVQFTLDGAAVGPEDTVAPYATTWATTGATNGTHVLRAIARDAAGNSATSGAATVTVNNVTADTTAPTVAISAPGNGASVNGTATIAVTATDNVAVAGVQVQVEGMNFGAEMTAAPYQISWSTSALPAGVYHLTAVARDAAGNRSTAAVVSVSVNMAVTDATPPSVAVTIPQNGAGLSGAVMVTATASDNVGVVGVQFSMDGRPLGSEVLSLPYQVNWATNLVLNGSHVLTATARDAAGNTQTSAPVTVTVTNLGSGVAGDLNGDGLPDLLFEHSSGLLYAWFMSGGSLVGEGTLTPGSVGPAWKLVAVDDFNGDKRSDLLWQNTSTGQLYLWLMDGITLIGQLQPPAASLPWLVQTTGDFNGDGKPDIVWKNSQTGELYVWLMDGINLIGGGFLTPQQIDPAWRIAGAADIDHDGKTDLIFQHTNGSLAVWLMDGLTAKQTVIPTPGAVGLNWQLRSVADYDGDGNADFVWENSNSGQLYIWYMNGISLVRDGFLTPNQVAPAWQIVGSR